MLRFPYDVKNFCAINFTMPPIMRKFVQSGNRQQTATNAGCPH